MSMFSGVDWSKAAAAWVSQKQKLEREKELVNQQVPNPLIQSVQVPNFSQLTQVIPQTCMTPQKMLQANLQFPIMQMDNSIAQSLPYPSTVKSSSVLKPSWSASNAKKPIMFGSEYSSVYRSNFNEASVFDDISRLLPMLDKSNNEDERGLVSLVKQRVTSILMSVTDSLVKLLAQETLNEAHLISAQQQQQKQMQQSALAAASVVPNRPTPAVIFPSSTRALQLQLSYAALPVQPVILGEAGQALEEDNSDVREEMENNGMPFIVPEEPTKGLFKRPPDEILLVEGRTHVGRFNDQCVRVVCYSSLGKNLGELQLNGRYAIIFGSNPRQSNILDSHPSVYSQHCAIGLAYKNKPQSAKSAVACSLYLFPLGGSTKMYYPNQIPFARFHQNLSVDLSAPQGPFDTCADGDRKREISIGSQIYIQLGSSQRYYLIDASCWRKTYVLAKNSNFSFYTSESLERINRVSDSPIEILADPEVSHKKDYEYKAKVEPKVMVEENADVPKNPVEKIIKESIKKEKDEAIIRARMYASEHLMTREKKVVEVSSTKTNLNESTQNVKPENNYDDNKSTCTLRSSERRYKEKNISKSSETYKDEYSQKRSSVNRESSRTVRKSRSPTHEKKKQSDKFRYKYKRSYSLKSGSEKKHKDSKDYKVSRYESLKKRFRHSSEESFSTEDKSKDLSRRKSKIHSQRAATHRGDSYSLEYRKSKRTYNHSLSTCDDKLQDEYLSNTPPKIISKKRVSSSVDDCDVISIKKSSNRKTRHSHATDTLEYSDVKRRNKKHSKHKSHSDRNREPDTHFKSRSRKRKFHKHRRDSLDSKSLSDMKKHKSRNYSNTKYNDIECDETSSDSFKHKTQKSSKYRKHKTSSESKTPRNISKDKSSDKYMKKGSRRHNCKSLNQDKLRYDWHENSKNHDQSDYSSDHSRELYTESYCRKHKSYSYSPQSKKHLKRDKNRDHSDFKCTNYKKYKNLKVRARSSEDINSNRIPTGQRRSYSDDQDASKKYSSSYKHKRATRNDK